MGESLGLHPPRGPDLRTLAPTLQPQRTRRDLKCGVCVCPAAHGDSGMLACLECELWALLLGGNPGSASSQMCDLGEMPKLSGPRFLLCNRGVILSI